jgi:hypothetical protein
LLGIQWGAYSLILGAAALVEAVRRRSASLLVGLPLSWCTMHIAWGGAFWWGLIEGLIGRERT